MNGGADDIWRGNGKRRKKNLRQMALASFTGGAISGAAGWRSRDGGKNGYHLR